MGKAVAVADLLVVALFVAIGRGAHGHGLSPAGMATTAWPFLAGAVAGLLLLALLRRPPASLGSGLLVSLFTVAIGMALRVVAGQGTAPAFVGVAFAFLGAAMLGWRTVIACGRRRLPRLGRRQTGRPGRALG